MKHDMVYSQWVIDEVVCFENVMDGVEQPLHCQLLQM